MDNATFFDGNSFGTFNESATDYSSELFLSKVTRILMAASIILKLLVYLATILSCVLLVYILHKFKQLQTRTNSYLWHYTLFSIAVYILMPVFDVLHTYALHRLVNHWIHCAVYCLETVSYDMLIIFITLMGIDWFSSTFNNRFCQVYRDHYKWLIGGLYLLFLVKYCSYILSDCFAVQIVFHNYFTTDLYFILLLAIIVVNLWAYFKVCNPEELKGKHALTISTVVLCSWLMLELTYLGYMLGFRLFTSTIWYEVEEILVNSGPMFVLFWMVKRDCDFHKAWLVVFRRKSDGYTLEDFDDVEKDTVISTNV